jgi:hypothetical protein
MWFSVDLNAFILKVLQDGKDIVRSEYQKKIPQNNCGILNDYIRSLSNQGYITFLNIGFIIECTFINKHIIIHGYVGWFTFESTIPS